MGIEEKLNEAIYDRYIKPTKRPRTDSIGLEFELPILNRTESPVDFSVVHSVTEDFVKHFQFSELHRDDDG